MEGAEPRTKEKRIRHCYPRKEVYHRFIHDNNYYYSSKAYAISSKGNYLALGDIGRYKRIEDIEEYWYSGNRVFAVIDRENKKILVSHKYECVTWELIYAIPNDFEIFHCTGDIPLYNILHYENIDTLAKLHLQHSIERYTNTYLTPFYACYNGKKILHESIDCLINPNKNIYDSNKNIYNYNKYFYYYYEEINRFVNKYKVKKRPWYKETLNSKFNLCIHYPFNLSCIDIELPSVKKVLTNTVFSKSQKEKFRKLYFYTKYCYGRGIPYKDVDAYFNTPITNYMAIEYCNKRNIYLNRDWLVNIKTWNELISQTKEIGDKAYKKYIDEQVTKSRANYEAALEELRKIESEYTVNSWREGNNKKQYSINYRKYCTPRRHNDRGTWITATIRSSNETFNNTQLKLENNIIRTSRNATVTLEEGIKMYKIFKIGRANNPNRTSWTVSDFGKVNVGIYNLRFIVYKDKVTDFGVNLGYKEWCIQIGCHSLWLDDIEDFIRYYHLEDKINSTKINN